VINTEKNLKVAYLFDFYGEILSEKQQLAIELYYNDDLSLREVAAQLGISRQGVRDSLKRSETALFEMEEKLGLAARFGSVLAEIDRIRQNAVQIKSVSSDNAVCEWADEIKESADKIAKNF